MRPLELKYETCVPGANDYYDQILNIYSTPALLDLTEGCEDLAISSGVPLSAGAIDAVIQHMKKSRLSPKCVFGSLMGLKESKARPFAVPYAVCKKSELQSKIRPKQMRCEKGKDYCRVRRPCITPKYHLFVYESFLKAIDCLGGKTSNGLGLTAKELFPILNVESTFKTNIGYIPKPKEGAAPTQIPNEDWGIGQLNPKGVKLADEAFQSLMDEFKKGERPECAPVAEALAKPIENVRGACDRVGYPENPVRNFLYSGLLYLQQKSEAVKLMKYWEMKKDKFEKRRKKPARAFSAEERERVLIELSRYMYNGTLEGVSTAFETFLDEPANLNMDVPHFKKKFSAFLHSNYGGGDDPNAKPRKKRRPPRHPRSPEELQRARKLVSHYAPAIENQAQLVGKQVGEECSL